MTSPYDSWLGRSTQSADTLSAVPVRLLSALLDADEPPAAVGDEVAPLRHWLCFLPADRQSAMGNDGHPQRGSFLPPVPLPRRMWAGSALTFHRPVRVGDELRRTSTIAGISKKQGSTGELVFVRVAHELSVDGAPVLSEMQDIVYRGAPQGAQATGNIRTVPAGETFCRSITTDPVLLFRYSALTFNAHRIHYDRPYAIDEEGYPGLVVQGPLIATLLLDTLLLHHPGVRLKSFAFKAVAPLFDTASFQACGRIETGTASLWARGPHGELAMSATAELA
jgi:3-methylfumaryl-CoA hydratase